MFEINILLVLREKTDWVIYMNTNILKKIVTDGCNPDFVFYHRPGLRRISQ